MTPQQELFCREYCRDWNATRAAIAAGYSQRSAGQLGHELLKNHDVAAWVEREKARATSKVELCVEDVVRSIADVIKADPRELSETIIGACRYCHGEDHMYQCTPQEFRDRYAAWEQRERNPAKATGEPFQFLGGDGFKRYREPHPECPECEGDGVLHTRFKDTRKLSASAANLYMGVKQTASGIEILTRSKDKAIEQAAKYLGMNKEQLLVGDAPSGLGHFYGETEEDDA